MQLHRFIPHLYRDFVQPISFTTGGCLSPNINVKCIQ